MNLYLKYRPKTIDELDLVCVRKTLGDMVKSGNIGHAYLLTGPRGVGKTSTARVLARIVNCEKSKDKLGEPCNVCSACKSILESSAMDVIEIDAASNRGIDDIRELKERIRLSPAILPRKIYIIDEVHMLTTEAFNALLKTLEEPPSHSLFILCTTELHKVPETIISRCVQIQFTKAMPEEMRRSFKRVVKGEGKKVSEEALAYLSRSVDGSFRDGVKILDQVLGNIDNVELADIEKIISGSSNYRVAGLVESLAVKDVKKSLELLAQAVANGVDTSYLIVSLMRGLKEKLIMNQVGIEVTKFIFVLDEVARRLATSLDGELLLQVAIIEWCGESGVKPGENTNKSEPRIEKVAPKKEAVEHKETSESKPLSAKVEEAMVTQDGKEVWKQVLGSLGSNNLALDTILSKARPGNIHGDELTIYVQYDFHKQQLMSEKNLVKLEQIISKAVGKAMKVKCDVSDPSSPMASEGRGDTIDDAMAIFTN